MRMTTSLVYKCPHTQIGDLVSLGVVYPTSRWVLDRYICLSDFLFSVSVADCSHSDTHWPGIVSLRWLY